MKHTNKSTNKLKVHIAVTLAVMILIFIHSAMPGDMSGSESGFFAQILASLTGMSFEAASFAVRKAAHFTEYAVLGICLSVNFCDLNLASSASEVTEGADLQKSGLSVLIKYPHAAAWICGTLYAATDEFHQLFVNGRSGEIRDVCIDAAGVALGAVIHAVISKR